MFSMFNFDFPHCKHAFLSLLALSVSRVPTRPFFLRVKAAILRVRDLKSCGLKLRVGDEPATQPATRKSDVLLLEPANLDEKVAA